MRSTILISKIIRVLETEGAIGDGVSLASAYASAVQAVNQRLESVHSAMEAKQISDAVSLLEAPPRLLEEINLLDFNLLPNWVAMCKQHGWSLPMPIDHMFLERVLRLNESGETVEPFLKMYRKAVRTNQSKLAVLSLRRLVEVDATQNWKSNLVQAETAFCREQIAAFQMAVKQGDQEESDRLASEILDEPWSIPPTVKGFLDIGCYRTKRESEQRAKIGTENVDILKKNLEGTWNRALVLSLLKSIDTLVKNGWDPTTDQQLIIEACRKRCSDELEAEERDRYWKSLCENLHMAIQHEDVAAIREALAVPEFLDHEPDAELIQQARLVIHHADMQRKQKLIQVTVCVIAGIAAMVSLATWRISVSNFDDLCEREANRLAELEKSDLAIDRLKEALAGIERNSPEVYTDPRVNLFTGKLATRIESNLQRTNELTAILVQLEDFHKSQWPEADTQAIAAQIKRGETLLQREDSADKNYRVQLRALKSNWLDHVAEVKRRHTENAEQFCGLVIKTLSQVAEEVSTSWPTSSQRQSLDECVKLLKTWTEIHLQYAPTLASQVTPAEAEFGKATNRQSQAMVALEKLQHAQELHKVFTTREELRTFYPTFPFIDTLRELPYAESEAIELCKGAPMVLRDLYQRLESGIDDNTFRAFVDDKILPYEKSKTYGLKGLRKAYPRTYWYSAILAGDQVIRLEEKYRDMRRYDEQTYSNYDQDDLPSSRETQEVLDFVRYRSNVTAKVFENYLLTLIDKHLKEGRNNIDTDYREKKQLSKDLLLPYRRIQLLDRYMRWLKNDLKCVSLSNELDDVLKQIDNLATPIHIEGIEDSLSWLCLWDERIRERNEKCKQFFRSTTRSPSKWVEMYKEWTRGVQELKALTSLRVEFAGKINFLPQDSRYLKDKTIIFPNVLKSIAVDHPLYVLRKDEGRLVLVKALVPSKKGAWALANGLAGDRLLPGEPLFQVVNKGKTIDAEAFVKEILETLPVNVRKEFVKENLLFRVEVK